VASFFVSRVDAKLDARMAADSPLRGRAGIANARLAHAIFRQRFSTPRWLRLVAHGAEPQRPLWASTATKDPQYRDVMYLEQLALRSSILTVPEATLRNFAEHGDLDRATELSIADAKATLAAIGATALQDAATELESEGVDAFSASYRSALDCLRERVAAARSSVSASVGQAAAARFA
jgi:transaldolase